MKKLAYITVLLVLCKSALAQNASKLMRDGLLDYKKGDFATSIEKYKQALKGNADRNLANYNIGAAYYKAGKPDSALMYWQSVATTDDNKELQSRSWHNIGNSFVKQGNFEKAVDAYKRSLKLNPQDEDTRYNLAYSQRVLQQQQQQNQNQDKDKNKEQKEQSKPEENEDLNKNDAQKILEALDNKEKDLHKKGMGGKPASPSKDW